MSGKAKSIGIIGASGAGLFSAFALAACCALPMALSAIGLGSAWLTPLVAATNPYATILRIVAPLCILASVLLVAVNARRCAPGDLCARKGFRVTVYAVALLSAVLLAVSFVYK